MVLTNGSSIAENTATSELSIGGLENNGGTATLSGSSVTENFGGCDIGAGGIYNLNGGKVTLNTSTVSFNIACSTAAGIYNDSGSTLVLNGKSRVTDNTWGGGVWDVGNIGTLTVGKNAVIGVIRR